MLRFLLTIGFIAVTVALRAVTVKWQVPNSSYAWVNDASAYFVYSESAVTDANLYDAATPGLPTGSSLKKGEYTGLAELKESGGLSASFDGLSDDKVSSGYFYLILFNKNSSSADYTQYVVIGGVHGSNPNGVYSAESGVAPEKGDYVDSVGIIGGNWSAAKTPEPTALALLALGMAGALLRRKAS